MTNPLITRADLRAWGACWSDEEIAARVPPEGVTLRQVLDARHVKPTDRVWVATYALPESDARLFGCRCARRALFREQAAGREPAAASWAAVDVAERYAHGQATTEELATARFAAEATAMSAAGSARAAAWSAEATAMSAARTDARSAAKYAAWYAAWYASRTADAASDAERRTPLADLRRVTEEA